MTTTKAPTGEPWLEIDLKGFAQILHNKGVARIALEPISNALDTEAAEIEVSFAQAKGWAELDVTDNDPDGFADLRDTYLLFAPSNRRNDPTKRGRFGQGEKELIAVCSNGGSLSVASTTGTVLFEKDGRRQTKDRLPAGTRLAATFRCNQRQAAEFGQLVQSLLIPAGVTLTYNGTKIAHRKPVLVVKAKLPTKIADDDGNLTDTVRATEVELIEPAAGEKATIFELGVPVVEHDGRWHCNIGQKVPLNTARDNVTPAYLRRLREIMLNETHSLLTSGDMKRAWVTDALPKATPEALREVVEKIHGKDAVIADPSCPEATKRAVDQGRTVVYGRQFSADTWKRIKDNDILQPAGKVIQVGIPTSPDGVPPIDPSDWSPAMGALAGYVSSVGEFLLGFTPNVEFHNIAVSTAGGHAAAWWGGRTITFNLRYLGKAWAETAPTEEVDGLLIHEFAHHFASDHFSDRFVNACCNLGAKLRSCPTHR